MSAQHARRPGPRVRPLGVAALFTVGFVLASAGAAWAYFTAAGSGTGALATAGSVNQGATPSATVSGRDVKLEWVASTLSNGQAVSGYTITKTNVTPGTLSTTVTSTCAGSVNATTCLDKGLAESGTTTTQWKYTVTPVFDQWKGKASAAVTVTVPGPTSSLSATTFTTLGGSATATVSNYFDTETAYFCVTADVTTTCPTADKAGTATVPSAGGTTTKAVTIPAGLSVGTHTLYAKGSDGSNPTGITINVTSPPVQFLGAGSVAGGTGGGTHTVAYPSPAGGLKATDLLLLAIARSHDNTISCPATWSANSSTSTTTGNHAFLVVCYKRWTAGSSVTISTQGTNVRGWAAEVMAYRNVTTSTTFDVTSTTSASSAGAASFSAPGLTTASANDMAVSVVMENDGTTTVPTLSLSAAQGFSAGASGGGLSSKTSTGLDFAYKSLGAAGAVTFPTWTTTTTTTKSVWLGISVALKDDPPVDPTGAAAGAAPTLVQSVSGGSQTPAATLSLALPATVTPGDSLTLAIGLEPGSASVSAVSGGGVTWELATSTGAASLLGDAEVWYGLGSAGASGAVTVTLSGPAVVTMAEVSEWTGVASLDTTAQATGTGTSVSAGAVSPSQSGDLIVSAATATGNTTGAVSANAPFAAFSGFGTTSGYYGADVQDTGVVSPTTITWTDASTGSWAAAAAAFAP